MNQYFKQECELRIIVVSLCFFALLFAQTGHAQEQNPSFLFRNLTPASVEELTLGKTVFHQPENWKKLSIPENSPYYKDIQETIRKGGFNYIGEILLVQQKSQAQKSIPTIWARLLDFEHYAGIPYWSSQKKKYYDLFDWIVVNSGSRTNEKGSVESTQFMKPFGEYSTIYEWTYSTERLSFSGVNTTPIFYKSIKAVTEGNMIWRFRAWQQGNYWVFYGLGAVKAFDLFGTFKERLSTSLTGRSEAFFRYTYGN